MKKLLSNQELSLLAEHGWLVGPEEEEEEFLQRIALYSNEMQNLNRAHQKIQQIFGITPLWITTIYSNQGLPFWQGGCTFIEGNAFRLQLRASFKNKSYSFFYSKEEILSHEYIHVARMAFNEPIFEEFFAYLTASTSFRRFFGPFFRTSKESSLFLGFMITSSLTNFVFPMMGWTWGLLGLVMGGGIFRLWKTHLLFRACFKRVNKLTGSKQKALLLMLLLTDREIQECAKLSSDVSSKYFLKIDNSSLRLRQLNAILNDETFAERHSQSQALDGT